MAVSESTVGREPTAAGALASAGEVPHHAHIPTPPSERGAWVIAGAIAALGVAVLVAVLTGLIGGSIAAVAPPPVLVRAATPAPASPAAYASAASALTAAPKAGANGHAAIVASPAQAQAKSLSGYYGPPQVHIAKRWMEGFYPIYATAQRTFGVSWLLIASIHDQESAFSTAPGTYHGLNFAGCCGGPMQFNVRNGGAGAPSTWNLVSDSYRYGVRPAAYDHPTATHPSIYDDFDAVMAAAHLLSADGAGMALDGSAWDAAYDYYGHDAAGVTYADQVLARAIGWSQHGFCINCGLEEGMVAAVHAAYGAPVLAALEASERGTAERAPAKKKAKRPVRSARRPPGR
ncbi:MAG TPA: hypothetical protein VL972_07090 [Solirubrobacteraceae bacterium]|nr:hypothetical protein [Solirubrobacteraceae bacterium]